MFTLFALLLTYPNIPEKILMYQRLRIIGLMIGASAWIFCMYDIYFKHSIVPKVNLLVTLLFATLVPTPAFLSLPIRSLSVDFMRIPFQYHLVKTNPAYSLYALCLIGVFCYSIVRVALCKNPPVSKIYGLMAFLPSIIGGIHDFAITHDIIRNIMISEYLFLGLLTSVFVLFMREEQQNYIILKKLTLGLEDEIL
ncbi:MAG: hypothetical protein NTV89_03640, partial [Proteobacteria bacterium]|nr:hypothetical protein [Pseudomonadota bacterium]